MILKKIIDNISIEKLFIAIMQIIITVSFSELGIFLKKLFLDHIRTIKNKGAVLLPNITNIIKPIVIRLENFIILYFLINFIMAFFILYKKDIKIYIIISLFWHIIALFLYINILCATFAPDMLLKGF